MTVRLEAWADGDLPLLRRLLGDPAMTEHLGGPESEEKIVARQARYEQLDPATGRMFKIVDEASGEPVGSVGYWEKDWRDTTVWETGWSVLPAHRWFHAFPSVDNAPSNAICRKLGFEPLGAFDFEYPPGNPMRCNDWRLDLFAAG